MEPCKCCEVWAERLLSLQECIRLRAERLEGCVSRAADIHEAVRLAGIAAELATVANWIDKLLAAKH